MASVTSSTYLDDQLNDWIVVPKMPNAEDGSRNGSGSSSSKLHPSSSSPSNPPSRPQSHQSGTIINHWNDLPSNLIPSNSSSRGSSRSGTPNLAATALISADASAQPNRYPSPLSTIAAEASNSRFSGGGAGATSEGDLQPLGVLLPALYNLPSKLNTGEHKMMQTRLNKLLLPSASNKGQVAVQGEQERFLRELLQSFVVKGEVTPAEVREELVSFMMREQGVAAWAASVRRLAESVLV